MKQHRILAQKDNTLAQQCYEQIKKDIIDGHLKPGQKIKVLQLKERFGIGQTPIREALSQLLHTGLVTFEDNKGFRVATISEADIRDTYATFILIETSALRLALEHGDVEWEAGIVAAYHKLSQVENASITAWEEWAGPNYAFHHALIAGCNSPNLLEIQALLYLKFERYACIAYQLTSKSTKADYRKEKKEHHKLMVELALKRDIEKSVQLMAHHIGNPLEDVIALLKSKKLI